MKKGIKVLFKSISMCFCLLFMASFFSACAKDGTETNAYTISGYVFDEYGTAVEGVTISSDFGNSVTDENGKYTFSNIEGSIVLSPAIEGYKFAEVSKYIKSSTDDANFVAYKEYTVSGTAHNNTVAVPNANIKLTSLAGDYYTTTDEEGKFSVSGVAGTTSISCEVDGIEFYSSSASLDAPNVSINTTSSLTIKVDDLAQEMDFSKIELWVNGAKLFLGDNEKVIENVKCGSTVELKSEYYHFDKPSTFVVDELNQVESFNLSRLYSVAGNVKSGETPIENANVFVDGKLATTTNASGGFTLAGLWGEREIETEFAGFDFNKNIVDYSVDTVSFNGTKQITLDILFDFSGDEDVSFSNSTVTKEDEFYLFGAVELGEAILVNSSKYHLSQNSFVVGADSHYLLSAQKYYDVVIVGLDFDGATILLDGVAVDENGIKGLFGAHVVSANYENYLISSASVDARHAEANLEYKIPYSPVAVIMSGDIALENAKIAIGKTEFITNANGEVALTNVFVGDVLEVSCENYNDTEKVFNAESTLEFDLSYDISGYVLTGETAVDQAVVSNGTKSATTNADGYFEIEDIYGTNELVVTKTGFVFGDISVDKENEEIEILGTYSISGKVEVEDISGYKLNYTSVETTNTLELALTGDGEYEISGLSGEYVLYVLDSKNNISLNPQQYNVSGAGIFNFSSSGFSVEGYVKTGEIPVAYAKVSAGALSVYTNADGYYKFELLTSAQEISVSKTGYEFSNSIRVEEDATDINFSATYTISGEIEFGDEKLSGVEIFVVGSNEAVAVSNAEGKFEISNLSGEVEFKLEKDGYVFENIEDVDGFDAGIEVEAKIISTIVITSGGVNISGADYYINGEKVGTADSHEITLTLSSGDVVSFEKEGCSISNVVISNQGSYEASATYSVSASVVSGAEALSGFDVYLNGKITKDITLEGNAFEITGLAGENTLTVAKNGFVFETKTVSSSQNIKFEGLYKISGTCYVGTKLLAGVEVLAGGKTATTDANGQFEISGLSGKVSVSASKTGYNFDSYSNKIGEQSLTFDAKYTLAGVVKSGDLIVAGANVLVVLESAEDTFSANTDAEGKFEIAGIKGNSNIIISKDGYTSLTIEGFDDYTSNISADLVYSYTFNFDTDGVTVYLNGVSRFVSGTTVNLSNLKGTNVIKFEKANTAFSRNNFEIKQPGTYSISTSKSYVAEGYVKAEIGHAISGVTIRSESGDVRVTDSNGYYKFEDVAGVIYIDHESITRENKNVDADATYNFTVSNADYSFMLYDQAIKKLDGSSSVQIFGEGEVLGKTSVMNTTQYVYAVVKRDQKGNMIRQNLNYGETVNAVVITVDPKVSLVVVGTNNNGNVSWEYEDLRKEAYVTSKTSAKHTTAGLKSISASDFNSTYGSYPNAYLSYVINSSTCTLTSLNYSGGTYTIVFNSPMSSQSGYQKQIAKLAPSGTTYTQNSSSYTRLTVKIKNGWITEVQAHDEYKIYQKMDVSVTSDVTYTFHTNKSNLQIDLISRNDVNGSLKLSNQTEAASFGSSSYDVVSRLIYGK